MTSKTTIVVDIPEGYAQGLHALKDLGIIKNNSQFVADAINYYFWEFYKDNPLLDDKIREQMTCP